MNTVNLVHLERITANGLTGKIVAGSTESPVIFIPTAALLSLVPRQAILRAGRRNRRCLRCAPGFCAGRAWMEWIGSGPGSRRPAGPGSRPNSGFRLLPSPDTHAKASSAAAPEPAGFDQGLFLFAGERKPVCHPGCGRSLHPSRGNNGRPLAMASRITLPQVSLAAGKVNTSALA